VNSGSRLSPPVTPATAPLVGSQHQCQQGCCRGYCCRSIGKLPLCKEELLTRLGLTFYEERRYAQALKYSLRALEEVPNCPLALWDYAGSLEMLDQTKAALKVYLYLIRRGIHSVALVTVERGLHGRVG